MRRARRVALGAREAPAFADREDPDGAYAARWGLRVRRPATVEDEDDQFRVSREDLAVHGAVMGVAKKIFFNSEGDESRCKQCGERRVAPSGSPSRPRSTAKVDGEVWLDDLVNVLLEFRVLTGASSAKLCIASCWQPEGVMDMQSLMRLLAAIKARFPSACSASSIQRKYARRPPAAATAYHYKTNDDTADKSDGVAARNARRAAHQGEAN